MDNIVFPTDEVIDVALQAGELILENGGETYRAEETCVRIADSLGEKNASAFVTPTVIIVSVNDADGREHTAMRRITERTVNLRKIALLNSLSYHLTRKEKTSTPRQVRKILEHIKKTPAHKNTKIICAAGFSAFFFALMFGSSFFDAVSAFVIGVLLRIMLISVTRLHQNNFIVSVLSGTFISVLCEAASAIGVVTNTITVLTAVLMQVVPGLAIVNSIRDLISGDLMSGTARLVEAFMVALGLSVGAAFGVMVFSHVIF